MTVAEKKAVDLLHVMEAKGGPMGQNQMILTHLFANGPITPLESLRDYGVMRLGSRINDLRKMGIPITTVMIENDGKRYARYELEADRGEL